MNCAGFRPGHTERGADRGNSDFALVNSHLVATPNAFFSATPQCCVLFWQTAKRYAVAVPGFSKKKTDLNSAGAAVFCESSTGED